MSISELIEQIEEIQPGINIDGPEADPIKGRKERLPEWLKVRPRGNPNYLKTKQLIKKLQLHTVCQEARCPNIGECFGNRTATFMILGDVCTRSCGFCHISKGIPSPVDPNEPQKLADSAVKLGMKHVVITAVDRDDISDGGASHFSKVVYALKERDASIRVEVLTGDFNGDLEALKVVVMSPIDIFNHNLETVPSLYARIRPRTYYERSLKVIKEAKRLRPNLLTKSGLMLGLGEETNELLSVMNELRHVKCDILTLGQYLRPSQFQVPVKRYVHPREFDLLKEFALSKGFKHVESGPLVRSSYHADKQVS